MSTAPSPASLPAPRKPIRGAVFLLPLCLLFPIVTQIILRRQLAPGEFGTLNALFGVVLVAVAPVVALYVYLRRTLPGTGQPHLVPALVNRAALAWGIFSALVLFILLSTLRLPRASLSCFTILAVILELLALCGAVGLTRRWLVILGLIAAFAQLAASALFSHEWPSAESGLAAIIVSGLIVGLPALRDRPGDVSLAAAWQAVRPHLLPAAATISVVFALALFTNADRIAAQLNFGTADHRQVANLFRGDADASFADHRLFDDYQTAGLAFRWLLWALLPLLGVLYARRARLTRTTYASLHWLWIYLGALGGAAVLLMASSPVVNALFVPSDLPYEKIDQASLFTGFTGAFVLLGLVQAFAVFLLASRRHAECFVLAACSVAYTAFVFAAGTQPQLMTSCMFGGALMSLMIVLFTGVVRYARSHP